MSVSLAHGCICMRLQSICYDAEVRWGEVLLPGGIFKEDIPCLHYPVKRWVLNLEPRT